MTNRLNDLNDLNNMSDDDLLKIIHGGDYSPPTSAGSTEGTYDYTRTQAKIILHKRQKKLNKSLNRRTLWILILTSALVILTGLLIYFQFFPPRPLSESTKTLQTHELQSR